MSFGFFSKRQLVADAVILVTWPIAYVLWPLPLAFLLSVAAGLLAMFGPLYLGLGKEGDGPVTWQRMTWRLLTPRERKRALNRIALKTVKRYDCTYDEAYTSALHTLYGSTLKPGDQR